MSLSSFGFAASALVAGVALVWLASRPLLQRGRLKISVALLVHAIWGATLAFVPAESASVWLVGIELARYACWLMAMPALVSGRGGGWLARWNLLICAASVPIALLSPAFALLVLAFVGLVNVEQWLRNADSHQKPGAKLCALGLGGIFVYDLFLFSERTLMAAYEPQTWTLRGFVNAALMPVLVVGVSRLSKARSNLFVSRQAVFYSTAFIAVGLYLMVTALAAGYLRHQAGAWGEWLRLLLLLGAGLVLAMLIGAESPWRRLRIFLVKHFYSNKYDYRVEWLRFVRTLEAGEAEDVRVTSVRAIAQIFESPRGVLFLRQEGDGAYSPAASWSAADEPQVSLTPIDPDQDLVRFMTRKKWVIDVAEYRRAADTYESISLPPFLLRAESDWRLVSPLFQRERLLGFVVLAPPPAPFSMSYEDRDLLGMVGRHVATLLAHQAADRRLAESEQFDAFNRFAAFVMHDLKNSVAQLQLLASNASRHRANPEFIDDAFLTIENTASRISRLIAQFQGQGSGAAQQPVSLWQALQVALQRCAVRPPGPVVSLNGGGDVQVMAEPERLTAVFEHLLRNAQDAAGPVGDVRLSLEHDTQWAKVTIADTGPGMEAAFVREHLFRPFHSTKGSKGMGIGAYQAREYVVHMGGTVEVQSTPGSGTHFIIRIPLCQTNPSES